MDTKEPRVRIGEFSRRVGVSPDLLRAWERRYGLLGRSHSGGFRLRGPADEARIRAMGALLAPGLAAAEAARGGPRLAPPSRRPAPPPARAHAGALDALVSFDEAAAEAILDDALRGSRSTVAPPLR